MAGDRYLNNESNFFSWKQGVQTSVGVADAGKLVALNSAGKLNSGLFPFNPGNVYSVADYTSIQAALDAIPEWSVLMIPVGQINLAGVVTITKAVCIKGTMFGPGSIIAGTTGTMDLFNVTTINPVMFEDLCISSTVTKTAGAGIKFTPSGGPQNVHSQFNRVYFNAMFTAIDYESSGYTSTTNCQFSTNPVNAKILYIRDTIAPDSGDHYIANCSFYGGGAGAVCIQYESGGGLRCIGNKFLQGDCGIKAVWGNVAQSGIMAVIGNSFDGQNTAGIIVQNTSATSRFTDITISGNVFDGSPTIAFYHGVSVGGAGGTQRIAITGNTMIRNTVALPLINIASGNNYCIVGNLLQGPAGATAVSVGVGAGNVYIGLNACIGILYANASTTTYIQTLDLDAAGNPLLILGGPANLNATFAGSAPIVPALLNSWINSGGALNTVGYLKDLAGYVHLRGNVKNGGAGLIFTLPAGYRPVAEQRFATVENNTFAQVKIEANGNVTEVTGGTTALSLDGIVFDTH